MIYSDGQLISLTMVNNGSTYVLSNLEKGKAPECRLESALVAQQFVGTLIDANDKRNKRAALVSGLCDGNPPFSPQKLREAGRADASNFNDGSARATLEGATGAFYDLISEAPGRVSINTDYGNSEERIEWSRILSTEADLELMSDKSWDTQVQTSITETVLHGNGPLFFETAHSVLPTAVAFTDLLVPDRASSDLGRWEIATVLFDYTCPQLYARIRNEEAAKAIGWDVEHTKLVIMHAIDQKQPSQREQTWSWFQNELKSNSFDYWDQVQVVKLAHMWWSEFDGRVSEGIVEREDNSGQSIKWLYKCVGKYKNFYEAIHPMYYDKGREGLHHNVTGLGSKMYSMFSYLMRLGNNLMDKTFAPKTLFQPATAEAAAKFQLQRMGEYALMTPGVTVVQAPIQGYLSDGLAMFRNGMDLMRSNLSQYRQQVQPDKPGNPETAFKERMNAAQQGALSNTTFARYYVQLDALYSEIVRRLCNLNSTDARAIAFQKRCVDKGVPRECFGMIESVKAVRVVGGGNPLMRKEAIVSLQPVVMRFNEQGQANWLDDFVSATCGGAAVNRYNPHQDTSQLLSDQRERAVNQISNARNGTPPVPSSSQNPVIFAGLFIQAAVGAVGSIKQGANPQAVLMFLETIGPGIKWHVQRLEKDPTRQDEAKALGDQAKQLASSTDKLQKLIQKQIQSKQKQQGKTASVMTDAQLAEFKTKHDAKLKEIKTFANLRNRSLGQRQNMALADARVASEIRLNRLRSLSE